MAVVVRPAPDEPERPDALPVPVLEIVVEGLGGVTETNGDEFSVGYCVLYGSAFAAAILGSVFVTRIKSVP